MTPRRPRRRRVRFRLMLAVAALSVALAGLIGLKPAALQQTQERVFDAFSRLAPAAEPAPAVIVVDIGETDETGSPWTRESTARLVARLAREKPAVLAFDIVFSGDCTPGAVNGALASAFAQAPVVLGFLLTDTGTLPPRPRSRLALDPDMGGRLWRSAGAESACPAFARAAAASGSMALIGDADGTVRRISAGVVAARQPYLSLALEAVRLARGDAAPALGAAPSPWLRLGGQRYGLDGFGQIRFWPSPPDHWPLRTLAAEAVLRGEGVGRVAGSLVFIGSSLPQRGGLRPTASSPLQPSVQIQADLATGLLAGHLPYRPAQAALWEAGFVLAMGAVTLVLLALLPALTALAVSAAGVAIWAASCVWLASRTGLLLDPVFPAAAALATTLLVLIGQAMASARAERALRTRMGQLLPPAVISRLVATPDLLRLQGEAREVTALCTDIEAFSAMTHTLGPQALVRVLDRYFTLTGEIVLRHGGMVDKIVGDSVHALFNAPIDQPGHVDAALACAAEIATATEALRGQPDMAGSGLGRTRIGIETGPAVLGDVGSGAKIDYTAYGEAVNLAARLQDANKDLGTQICIGPAAAAAAKRPLRALGEVEVRSFGRLALFTLPAA